MQPLMQFPTSLPILLKQTLFHWSAEISWQAAADPFALMPDIKPWGSVHLIGSPHQKGTMLENLSSMMFHASDIVHKFWKMHEEHWRTIKRSSMVFPCLPTYCLLSRRVVQLTNCELLWRTGAPGPGSYPSQREYDTHQVVRWYVLYIALLDAGQHWELTTTRSH